MSWWLCVKESAMRLSILPARATSCFPYIFHPLISLVPTFATFLLGFLSLVVRPFLSSPLRLHQCGWKSEEKNLFSFEWKASGGKRGGEKPFVVKSSWISILKENLSTPAEEFCHPLLLLVKAISILKLQRKAQWTCHWDKWIDRRQCTEKQNFLKSPKQINKNLIVSAY